jgi:hypothetical protein
MAARVRGQRSGRLALAACLVLLGSLASVPAASAAEQAVAEGTVTSASTHAGIDDVEVRFYYGSNGYYKSETSGSGSYAGALPAGEYLVEFVPKAPYAFQYYKDAQSPETATRGALPRRRTQATRRRTRPGKLDLGNRDERRQRRRTADDRSHAV